MASGPKSSQILEHMSIDPFRSCIKAAWSRAHTLSERSSTCYLTCIPLGVTPHVKAAATYVAARLESPFESFMDVASRQDPQVSGRALDQRLAVFVQCFVQYHP